VTEIPYAWPTRTQCCVLQCGAVCCSVLQCAGLCCRVTDIPYAWPTRTQCCVLQCGAVCCSVLQCAVVCCSVLQCVAEWQTSHMHGLHASMLCEQCGALRCILLQWVAEWQTSYMHGLHASMLCVAEWCIALQCAAVCCRVTDIPYAWPTHIQCCVLHVLKRLVQFAAVYYRVIHIPYAWPTRFQWLRHITLMNESRRTHLCLFRVFIIYFQASDMKWHFWLNHFFALYIILSIPAYTHVSRHTCLHKCSE